MSPDCSVDGCLKRIWSRRLCGYHYHRLNTYGSIEPPDPPIPRYDAPGVSEERLAELKAMPWKALVAYCDDVLRGSSFPISSR